MFLTSTSWWCSAAGGHLVSMRCTDSFQEENLVSSTISSTRQFYLRANDTFPFHCNRKCSKWCTLDFRFVRNLIFQICDEATDKQLPKMRLISSILMARPFVCFSTHSRLRRLWWCQHYYLWSELFHHDSEKHRADWRKISRNDSKLWATR